MAFRLPPTKTRILSYCLFGLSFIILAFSLYFTFNIKVLKDWKLVLPEGEIHAGQQVVISSEYTKLRNVDGTAVRYIECKNRRGLFIRYPINEAVADRQAGSGGTGIPVVIPREIPDLPARCKFSVSIQYRVLPLKTTPEKNSTKEFDLLPAVSDPR